MVIQDLNKNFMPHWLSRRTDGTIASLVSDVTHILDGDESVIFYLNSAELINATYIIEGSANSTDAGAADWFPLVCYPYAPATVGGTLPQPGQPIYTEGVFDYIFKRMLCASVSGLRRVRVRLTAHSLGSLDVSVTSDACASMHPYVRDRRAATLGISSVVPAGTVNNATLPAVTGLRHYIDFIKVTFSPTAAITASATPTTVSTTNVVGTPALTVGSKGCAIGDDFERILDFGASGGVAAINVGTATVVSCPAIANMITRITVAYRLGL